MENDVFQDGNKKDEIRRILSKVSAQIHNDSEGNYIFDINGNKIGKWEITEE